MCLGKKFREQRGVALISILLVVVIATVLGVKMTTEQYFSITRASNYFEQGKILSLFGNLIEKNINRDIFD